MGRCYRPTPPRQGTAGHPGCTAVAGTLRRVRVDQVIPSLASRDAIGAHTLALTDALRAAGIDSEIYYGNCTPDVADRGQPVVDLGRTGRDRWLLYQSSIGSPVYDILATRPEPKLVNYHNITPAHLLVDWEPNVGYEVSLGRTQLERLAPDCRLAVADSAFNEFELEQAGYANTAVVPLLIDMTATGADPDPELAGRLAAAKDTRRGRPVVRGQGLAAQGPPRPGQDARRLPPAATTPAPGCTWSARRWATATARP